ncbi:KGGVGR-motif variant AAA ATPase [Lentzea sp. NPDC051213]|uniref:KGGVGR-motif variant AAA ATPase n=1 Tax=Lentzea sp. NPDC051213 TaxID=3364126 RepID=UPI0037B9343A
MGAGSIVTFYSYKGGTGRSMSLANVAWILASNGRRVLVVDWDLEAPGLHRYFHPFLPDDTLRRSPGVIDMMWEFAHAAMDPLAADTPDWHIEFARTGPYAVPIEHKFRTGGTIDLMPAGRRDSTYSALVSTFDWDNFYDRLGGGGFLEALRSDMRERYDYILVDSRTGLSDTSGVCTVALPDVVVTCFSMSTQSIDGAAAVAASIAHQRTDELRILPVPMRVENGEHDKLETSRDYARHAFDGFLWHVDDVDRYWGQVEVPYRSYYAYEEILATIGDRPQQENTILAATERLVDQLTGGEITSLVAAESERKRRELLTLFLRTKASEPVGHRRERPDHKVFLTYAEESERTAARAAELLSLLGNQEFDAELDPDLRLWTSATEPAKLVVVEAVEPGVSGHDTGVEWDPDTVIQVRANEKGDAGISHLLDQLARPPAVRVPPLSIGEWVWGLDAVTSLRAMVNELILRASDISAHETSRLPVRWIAGGLTGSVESLPDVFLSTPSRKLIVLGEPGSGKSVAAVLLTRGLLAHKDRPTPILLSPSTWRPSVEYFDDWVVRTIVENYPSFLSSRNLEGDVTRLLQLGTIAPVIDGLDQLPEHEYEQALQQITDTTVPVVATTRTDEYRSAVSGPRPSRTSVVELLPVALGEALKYLSSNTTRRDQQTTNALSELAQRSDGVLTMVLATPAKISLVRSYLDSPGGDIVKLAAMTSPREAEEVLIGSYLEEAFGRRSRRPGEPDYRADRTRRWLAFIATRPGAAFRWWELHKSVSSRVYRLVLGYLGFLCTAPALFIALVWPLNAVTVPVLVSASLVLLAPLMPTPRFPASTFAAYLGLSSRRRGRQSDDRTVQAPDSERNRALGTVVAGAAIGAFAFVVALSLPGVRDNAFTSGYLAAAATAATLSGGYLGVALAMTTAWSRYAVSRLLLAGTHRLPWRLDRLLNDANRRGVLRRIGSVYEFRDRRLAEVLADRYRQR